MSRPESWRYIQAMNFKLKPGINIRQIPIFSGGCI
jgi:hypothetical protein